MPAELWVWWDGDPALFPFSISPVSEPFVCRHRHRVFICLKSCQRNGTAAFWLELNDNKVTLPAGSPKGLET